MHDTLKPGQWTYRTTAPAQLEVFGIREDGELVAVEYDGESFVSAESLRKTAHITAEMTVGISGEPVHPSDGM